jgi:hypothetical protein
MPLFALPAPERGALLKRYLRRGVWKRARLCGASVRTILALARIIEPSSKADAERVLGEVGAAPASYATDKCRLRGCAQLSWRSALAGALQICWLAHGTPAPVIFSCSASHAITTDRFQTRRRPSLNDGGPLPMCAQYRNVDSGVPVSASRSAAVMYSGCTSWSFPCRVLVTR